MKIEPPAVIIGGEYKEGAVVNFKWTNLFKRNQNVNNNSLSQEKEIKQFYDIEPIDNTNAVYRMIIGQRSNRQNLQRM